MREFVTEPFLPNNAPLSGRILVEASAGTGKTYAITTLFVRLLLEQDLRVDQILVVTFTEAATAELKDRVRCLNPYCRLLPPHIPPAAVRPTCSGPPPRWRPSRCSRGCAGRAVVRRGRGTSHGRVR